MIGRAASAAAEHRAGGARASTRSRPAHRPARTGEHDAITDVAGRAGRPHDPDRRATGRWSSAQGPVRTGVTVVVPHERRRLDGAGLRRLPPAQRQRRADRPRMGPRIGHARRRRSAITNTHSVGIVRDALIAARRRRAPAGAAPLVAARRRRDLRRRRSTTSTASTCGPSTSTRPSRRRPAGAVAGGQRRRRDRDDLPRVQGRDRDRVAGRARRRRRLDGRRARPGQLRRARAAPGRRRSGRPARSPSTRSRARGTRQEAIDGGGAAGGGLGGRTGRSPTGPGGGSIIVVVATDAPLLPHQCERLAQRASLGIARMGGIASHGSGDIFIAFATGNRGLGATSAQQDARQPVDARMVGGQRHLAAVPGDGRGHRGGDLNALLAAADDDRPRRDHGARASTTSGCSR